MRRFFTKIGRFFWSRGFLKFILWTVTLIVLFYVEEDWRGARAWAATKAKWETKGESLDYSKFIPPPVPDDENLAAIPLFKMEPSPEDTDKTNRYPVTLDKALRIGLPSNDTSGTGNWMSGRLPDMNQLRQFIVETYSTAFKGMTPPQDSLDQFDALFPVLSDLRAASVTRPLCRFDEDYSKSPPAGRVISLLTGQIKLSKALTLHALLALDHHQSDLALDDIKVNYKLLVGAQHDPSLIGGLVAIGLNSIGMSVIYNGLAQHAWNDAQLVEIDRTLKKIDYLAAYQFAMRSEVGELVLNVDYIKHAPRPEKYGYIFGTPGRSSTGATPTWWNSTPSLWPGGWWDQNKCRMTDLVFSSLASVDVKSRRVFLEAVLSLRDQIEHSNSKWDASVPWEILSNVAVSPITNSVKQSANAQSRIDEARIACALERYRLAHGVYPDSLDVLAPAYIDELPHDIINGEPLHYRLRPDGMFLLYSVGWNQTDDGGKIVYQKVDPQFQKYNPGAPPPIDLYQGDWVWPTPQVVGTK